MNRIPKILAILPLVLLVTACGTTLSAATSQESGSKTPAQLASETLEENRAQPTIGSTQDISPSIQITPTVKPRATPSPRPTSIIPVIWNGDQIQLRAKTISVEVDGNKMPIDPTRKHAFYEHREDCSSVECTFEYYWRKNEIFYELWMSFSSDGCGWSLRETVLRVNDQFIRLGGGERHLQSPFGEPFIGSLTLESDADSLLSIKVTFEDLNVIARFGVAGNDHSGDILFATRPDLSSQSITFPPAVPEVYALWTYAGMQPDMIIRRDWYRNGELWLQLEEPWDFESYGACGLMTDIYVYDYGQGLSSGKYWLDLYVDENLQKAFKRTFVIAERYEVSPQTSPNGNLEAAVKMPGTLVIRERDGRERTLVKADEIDELVWFPDGRHLAYVNVDRSRQYYYPASDGLKHEIWIVDVISGERFLFSLGNYHTLSIAPDGRTIALVWGDGYFDAGNAGFSLSFFELGDDLRQVAYHSVNDFDNDIFVEQHYDGFYPVSDGVLPRPGVWESNTLFKAALRCLCSGAGVYRFDLETMQAVFIEPLSEGT